LRDFEDAGSVAPAVLDGLAEALFFIDRQYRLQPLNAAAQQLGLAPEAPCHLAFFDRDQPCHGCPFDGVVGGRRQDGHCPGTMVAQQRPLGVRLWRHGDDRAVAAAQAAGDACACMLDNIASGLVLVDLETRAVIYANRFAQEVLGGALRTRPIDALLPGVDLRAASGGVLPARGDERKLYLDYRCTEAAVAGHAAVLVSFRDVTRIMQLSDDVKRMERLSEIGRTAAEVAHEIRNPLAGIHATVRSIQREAAKAGLGYAMELIDEAVNRLNTLLQDFSGWVRHRPPRRRDCPPARLIDQALTSCRPRLDQRQLEIDCEPSQPPAWIDPEQVLQVLINLLLNAADATRPGERIAISARTDDDGLTLAVEDAGCGIPAERLHRVRDAFHTTKPDGTGLGLAICERIARDHGGELSIDSTLNAGTRVTARFPWRHPR
jgi:signal transduction histidine kinase